MKQDQVCIMVNPQNKCKIKTTLKYKHRWEKLGFKQICSIITLDSAYKITA